MEAKWLPGWERGNWFFENGLKKNQMNKEISTNALSIYLFDSIQSSIGKKNWTGIYAWLQRFTHLYVCFMLAKIFFRNHFLMSISKYFNFSYYVSLRDLGSYFQPIAQPFQVAHLIVSFSKISPTFRPFSCISEPHHFPTPLFWKIYLFRRYP